MLIVYNMTLILPQKMTSHQATSGQFAVLTFLLAFPATSMAKYCTWVLRNDNSRMNSTISGKAKLQCITGTGCPRTDDGTNALFKNMNFKRNAKESVQSLHISKYYWDDILHHRKQRVGWCLYEDSGYIKSYRLTLENVLLHLTVTHVKAMPWRLSSYKKETAGNTSTPV